MARSPKRETPAIRRKAPSTEAPITPLRLPEGVKTLILFGGSFDPITTAHTEVVWTIHVVAMMRHTHVLFVPAAKSPLKAHGPVASDADRVAMIKAARKNSINDRAPTDWSSIWTDEIDRAAWERARGVERPSYTIDTVRRLRQIVPASVTLRLLIGSDQAVQFSKWKQHRTLRQLAEPLVLLRPPHRTVAQFIDAIAADGAGTREQLAWATRVLPGEATGTSSTQVREALPTLPPDAARWKNSRIGCQLGDKVARYIATHGLYGVATQHAPTIAKLTARNARR